MAICSSLIFAALQAIAAGQPAAEAAAAKPATPIQEKAVTYLIDNGPKLAGAILIIVAGLLAARWTGQLIMRWLSKKELEPPVRMLITRLTKLLVLAFALCILSGCGKDPPVTKTEPIPPKRLPPMPDKETKKPAP